MRSLAIVVLAGCIESHPLPLPPEASAARSAVFAVESPESVKVFAVDLEAAVFPPITVGETPLYLFLYPSTLAELGIAAGQVEPLAATLDGRPLPNGSIFVTNKPDTTWAAIDREAVPDSIESFRLPDFELGVCEAASGCFRVQNEEEYCQLPCVVPPDPMPPSMAAPPMPPVLTPCREGWIESAPYCVPAPAVSCPGRVQYLGDDFCSTPGGDCPAGAYAEGLPPNPTYVSAGAIGGDGSFAQPYGTIQQAIDAGVGSSIAIAKGTYVEPVVITRQVSLIGACAETIVGAPIEVRADASLRSLAVEPGSARTGLLVASGATADIADLRVSTAGTGIDVIGTLRGARALVGAGLGVSITGDVELDRAVVRDATTSMGIAVLGDGRADFTNLRASNNSVGVLASDRAMLSLSGVELTSNFTGLFASVEATIMIDDGLISRSMTDGILALDSASIMARRIRLTENGLGFNGSGGSAIIEDAYLEDPAVESNAEVRSGASLTLRRVVLAGSHKFGLHVLGGMTRLDDVQIRDNLDTNNQGEGIVVNGPSVIEASRLAIERVNAYAIRVFPTEIKSELRLDDLTLRDVRGYGIEMGDRGNPAMESTIAIHRLLAENIDQLLFCTVSGKVHEITDAIVRDLPMGGFVTIGGLLELTRAELSRIGGPSLSVLSGEMVLSDLRIVDPENGLVTEGYINTPVSAIDSAMSVNRFDISGASGAGILIRQFSRMRLFSGRIVHNQVGVEVRADGFVYSALEGDVIYRDNTMHNLLKKGQVAE